MARCLFVLPVDGQWNVFLCRLVIDLLGHSQNKCNFEERISEKDGRLKMLVEIVKFKCNSNITKEETSLA